MIKEEQNLRWFKTTAKELDRLANPIHNKVRELKPTSRNS